MHKARPIKSTTLLLTGLCLILVVGTAALSAATETASYLPVITAAGGRSSQHFYDCAFLTGNNATIGVPGDVTIKGGFKLAQGDEIAIFNEAGTLCAGMKFWSGRNIAITAWGNDPQTAAVDGLLEGEDMRYRIWDKSKQEEREVASATYKMGNGQYITNGLYIVESLTVK